MRLQQSITWYTIHNITRCSYTQYFEHAYVVIYNIQTIAMNIHQFKLKDKTHIHTRIGLEKRIRLRSLLLRGNGRIILCSSFCFFPRWTLFLVSSHGYAHAFTTVWWWMMKGLQLLGFSLGCFFTAVWDKCCLGFVFHICFWMCVRKYSCDFSLSR